jgi:hypothetical protein
VDSSNLIVEDQIGAGAFAIVCRGILRETPPSYRSRLRFWKSIVTADGSIIVAVKTPKQTSNDSQR